MSLLAKPVVVLILNANLSKVYGFVAPAPSLLRYSYEFLTENKMEEDTHQRFYNHAWLYEKAFNWRDIEKECQFLSQLYTTHTSKPLRAMLELACGPAEHARWYAAQQIHAHALDLNQDMLDYASAQVKTPDYFHPHKMNMCTFDIPSEPVGMACCLIDSIAYITTHDAFRTHLESVARALEDGGIYVIETVHPKDTLCDVQTTKTSWTVELSESAIDVIFGHPNNKIDPVSQITMIDVTLRQRRLCDGKILVDLTERAPLKLYLYQELLALIHGSPFCVVETFGALDTEVALDSSTHAWRTVLVLQKRY